MKKVLIPYKDENNDTLRLESVWCLSENENFVLQNSPFFVKNLSYGDIISADLIDDKLYFSDLVSESGHSCIHVVFFKVEMAEEVMYELTLLRCNWEQSHAKNYYSLDIPKNVSYQPVFDYLQLKLRDGILDFTEACISSAHREMNGSSPH